MSLTTQFASLIDIAVRNRGLSYFSQGMVRIISGDERLVEATVQGTSSYQVKLLVKGRDFIVSCTCPYYEDTDTCKHIWATILAAQSRGYLVGSGPEPTRLRMANNDNDYDSPDYDGYDYDYDDPEERWIRSAAAPFVPVAYPGEWKQQFAYVSRAMQSFATQQSETWSSGRELLYVLDGPLTRSGNGLMLEVGYRERKQNGEWSKLKTQGITSKDISSFPDPSDRQIIALLIGAKDQTSYSYYEYGASRFQIRYPLDQTLIPLICQTDRCRLRMEKDAEMSSLAWDTQGAWDFWLEIRRSHTSKGYILMGSLRRGDERRGLHEPAMLTLGGLVIDLTMVAPLNDFRAFAWISVLRKQSALYIPAGQEEELLEELLALPSLPRLDLPVELRFEQETIEPRRLLKLRQAERSYWRSAPLLGNLSFDYNGKVIADHDKRRGIFQAAERRFVMRDFSAERAAEAQLKQLGFRRASSYDNSRSPLELNADKLPRVVRALVSEGWQVEAEGKLYREPGQLNIQVRSGIDWFELHGRVEFGDNAASLPELLAALKRGESVVQLDDGTFGLLPEEWLKKYGTLARLGETEGDHLRFTRTQVGLLDALLASQPEAQFDQTFASARDQLKRFAGVEAIDPPQEFAGVLRGYQKEGLGWFRFLQQFGFGGCLADDMGTGKTVQALALLESRREMRARNNEAALKAGKGARKADNSKAGPGSKLPQVSPLVVVPPSLVVVPKSLVFNWKQEAARFAPQLRVLDHTGQFRRKDADHFDEHDLIITTYGTLRRDAVRFKDIEFDYVILDEAQAIKNADTASSKAARLLRARHRLALSGTPVENHLGELWALFDFLNPGLLGAASVFKLTGAGARNPDEDTRAVLAKALRPFILRRTKAQVARDLPPKLEQTIYCEMEPLQRKLYDELRDHYRRSLLGLVESRGIQRSKIQILEALLRLRQAACHPGLIDKKRVIESSAKLDVLLPQLTEVFEEGHKALVFSQFTSLLAIVRRRLDEDGINYEYLDGRTRDRASRVGRFQNDADCKLFLVSLKAGGLGLNLTAAEYVFLLDPWWNPAVEAQAIDRAHRIGQTKNVFAYRLIARDTVEEKVLELQKTKRELADAIINADNSLIRTLGREDLELLLS